MANTSPFSQDTPPSPGDLTTTASPNNDQFKVVRKRNRVPLSCAPCRTRKLKCNRSSPCENCVKRGESETCSYAPPGARKKTGSRSQPSGTPDDMQNRIDKLESLVLSLMGSSGDTSQSTSSHRAMSVSTSSNSNTPYTPPTTSEDAQRDNDPIESDTDKVVKSFGVLHFNNSSNQGMYIGDSHWATILNEISEVKTYFKEHQKQYEEAIKVVETTRQQAGLQTTAPAFLLVGRNPPEYRELFSRLPRRPEVDQLVQRYFQNRDSGPCVLHMPSWRRRYDNYWQNPGSSDVSFLGQLFAMCCLAMQSYFKDQDEPYEYQGRSQDFSEMYRGLTQQCLQLVDYTKIKQTTIETMLLHLNAEYRRAGEGDVGLWVLSRTVVSLAMRYGVHRDGKNFAGVSPFQREMRRRLWTFLRTVDTVWSFAVGLPSMISENDTDTEMPSNLNDSDFDEDTEIMPMSRPRSEYTDASYLIAKAEIVLSFSHTTTAISGNKGITYEEIMHLNDELRDVYHGTFPIFRADSDKDFSLEPKSIVTKKLNLSILYNKAVCVLHRKYLTRARENPRFTPSRQACVDAAMALLRNQAILEKESRAGGRMHLMQYHITSVMTHDFILAGTLTALDLLGSVQAEAAGRASGDIEIWGVDRKEEQLQAIEGARVIWENLKDRYVEAYKASSICGVMIQKIKQGLQQCQQQKTANGIAYGARPADLVNNIQVSALKSASLGTSISGMPMNEAANGNWKPGSYSGFQANNTAAIPSNIVNGIPNLVTDTLAAAGNPFPFFNGLGPETPANMDWNAWDEYMQNPNLDAAVYSELWPQNLDLSMDPTFESKQMPGSEQYGQTQANGNIFVNPMPTQP